MDGGALWAAVHGVAKSWRRLSDFTFTFHLHALEKEMATHSSVLAWRIPGTGEPGGLPSMGSRRVGHDWSDLAVAAWLVWMLVAQSCLTLCDPMDCTLPGFSVHGISQARTLEWVAFSYSRGFSWPRDRIWVSCTADRFFTIWATMEALCDTVELKSYNKWAALYSSQSLKYELSALFRRFVTPEWAHSGPCRSC